MKRSLTINVAEAAEITGFTQSAIRRALRDGALPSLRVGRLVRIPRIPLLKLLGVDEGESPCERQ